MKPHMKPQKAYAVYAGGGTRVFAFLGARKRLEEEHHYTFEKIAGVSGGSIPAFLEACGRTPDEVSELLEKYPPRTLTDFYPFPEGVCFWLYYVMSRFAGRPLPFNKTIAALLLNWRHARSDHLFRGRALKRWIGSIVDSQGVTYFREIKKELVIVAFDMNEGRPFFFSKDATPYVPIAFALCASMALWPFYPIVNYYDPFSKKTYRFADGGFWDKFPLHIFDTEGDTTPTVGFRLMSTAAEKDMPHFMIGGASIADLSPRLQNVCAIADRLLSFQDRFYLTPYEHYWTIKIDTGAHATLSDLTSEAMEDLVLCGRKGAEKFLDRLEYRNSPPKTKNEEVEAALHGPKKRAFSWVLVPQWFAKRFFESA